MAFPLELCNLVTKTITEVIWWMRSLVREQNKSDLNPQTIMRRMRIYAQGSRILKPDTSGNEGIEPKLVDKHIFSLVLTVHALKLLVAAFSLWLMIGFSVVIVPSAESLSLFRHSQGTHQEHDGVLSTCLKELQQLSRISRNECMSVRGSNSLDSIDGNTLRTESILSTVLFDIIISSNCGCSVYYMQNTLLEGNKSPFSTPPKSIMSSM